MIQYLYCVQILSSKSIIYKTNSQIVVCNQTAKVDTEDFMFANRNLAMNMESIFLKVHQILWGKNNL